MRLDVHCIPPSARPKAARLGEGWVWFILIFALIGFGLASWMVGQAKREAVFKFNEELSDPETLLNRFFIELGRPEHPLDDDSWRKLLAMTADEDLAWLDANLGLLAGYRPGAGVTTPSPDPDARRHDAACYLLDSQLGHEHPVVVRIAIDALDNYGVAYVHPPGHIELLREVFLARQGTQWRIRRFMGMRDDPALLTRLVADKKDKGLPLSPDEQAFQKDPKAHAVQVRDRLLKDAGLSPASVPATPAGQ
jgi:hypothetical protein